MEPILIAVAALVILLFVLFALFAKFYRKIEQGHALIVNTMRAEPTVTFTGCMVYPVIHKAELMEISVKTIEIDRSGREGLICKERYALSTEWPRSGWCWLWLSTHDDDEEMVQG